jgi:hypothetical protein
VAAHVLGATSRSGLRWENQEEGDLAFCGVTHMALLRLVANPAVTGHDALSCRDAWNAADHLMTDCRVRFLPEPETLLPLYLSQKLWKGVVEPGSATSGS